MHTQKVSCNFSLVPEVADRVQDLVSSESVRLRRRVTATELFREAVGLLLADYEARDTNGHAVTVVLTDPAFRALNWKAKKTGKPFDKIVSEAVYEYAARQPESSNDEQ